MINYKSKIYVAGHKGLVGSAITRNLKLQLGAICEWSITIYNTIFCEYVLFYQ